MKIAFFIDHLRPDGTQRALQQLVAGLAARGHQPAVVSLNDRPDPQLVQALRASGAEVRIAGKVALGTGYGLLTTWRWLRRGRFDVAVTLLLVSDLVARPLARSAGVPYIVSSLRARNTHYARWQQRLLRVTMRWADAVIINSESIRDFAIAAEGARPQSISMIPNGVAVAPLATAAECAQLRNALGLPADAAVIGSVGRLAHQKGFDVLLDALALLRRTDIHLLLIGTGEEAQALSRQAAARGLQARVHFLGYRRDVPALLGALDLYAQPSRFEGMPNALLEAMSAACPIVASAVDGCSELIGPGGVGWLVPPDDAPALAEALRAALADPAEARRRGAAARQRVIQEYGVDVMVAAWEKVLSTNARPAAWQMAERARA